MSIKNFLLLLIISRSVNAADTSQPNSDLIHREKQANFNAYWAFKARIATMKQLEKIEQQNASFNEESVRKNPKNNKRKINNPDSAMEDLEDSFLNFHFSR